MTFFSKVGNILKQHVSKQITSQLSQSNPSIYQAVRCMSSSKLFVGGLPYVVDDTTLGETFSQYGQVVEARVIIDRESNRSRGFGFVTFTSTEEASSAIQAMDGQDLQGRRVRVNYATDRAPRQFGGGGYGGGGYGGGSGGYGGGGYGGGGGSYGGAGYGGGGGGYSGGGGYGGSGGGGYGAGQNYGGGNSDGYGGGSPAGGQYGGGPSFGGDYGVAGGGSGSNVTAETGFASSGFEQGSGLGHDDSNQFGSNATGASADDNAGNYDPSEPLEGNFRDDDQPDEAKRA